MFKTELEKEVLPELTAYIIYWKMNVDGTIYFVKVGTINYIITKFNGFNNNIQFTFEEEHITFFRTKKCA